MAPPSSLGPVFEHVLGAAQSGAGWALARLYESLAPAVNGYLRAQGADDPEDLTSEVFIKVLTGCSAFSGNEAQFRSWVFSVAYCRLVDARRAKTRTHDHEVSDPARVRGDQGPVSAAAEEEALGRLATEQTTELLSHLSPDKRDVLLLRLLGQMSVQEVAAVLEAAVAVFVGAAGRLHDAVEGQKRAYHQLAHGVSPFDPGTNGWDYGFLISSRPYAAAWTSGG